MFVINDSCKPEVNNLEPKRGLSGYLGENEIHSANLRSWKYFGYVCGEKKV